MNEPSNFDQQSPTVNTRWSRDQVAQLLEQFELSGLSLQAFALANDVSASTLAYWQNRKNNIQGDPAWTEFFESPAGLDFLHRLQAASHFCFNQIGNNGIRLLCEFFQLCGLSPYLATSYGSQYAYARDMQEVIIQFGNEEKERLGEQMPHKKIAVGEDETYHPEICMVAMDLVSNYILVEQYEAHRDALTWTEVVNAGIDHLNVEIIQVTSDAAAGIRRHAQTELGVHHSPDLFHIQQDVCAGIFPGLYRKVREAEALQDESLEEAQAWREAQQQAAEKPPVGRPPNYEKYIAFHENEARIFGEAKAHWESRIDEAKQEVQHLGETYHPFNLQTGVARKENSASKEINTCFDRLEKLVEETELGERSEKRVRKARRQVKAMVATIAWFWLMVCYFLRELHLSRSERGAMERLIAACYLERVAQRTKTPEKRDAYTKLAEQLRNEALARDGPLGNFSEERLEELRQTASRCADLFQRSSSCVEGRNGQLSLRHHSFHHLTGNKLVCLTVLHNFWLKRADGTTAAERFFEAPPRDLFCYLISHLPYPSRSASPRNDRAASTSAQAA